LAQVKSSFKFSMFVGRCVSVPQSDMNAHANGIVFLAFLMPCVSAFIPGSNPAIVSNTPSVFRLPVTQATADAGIPILPNLPTSYDAVVPPLVGEPQIVQASDDAMMATRRQFMTTAAVAAAVGGPTSALASGGATAGGVYLIRAKQRYGDRVKQGAAGYLAIDPSLGAKDPFFLGGEKDSKDYDFTSSSFLLANAFRTTSTAAPNTLPTVKKWTAFLAEHDNFLKLSKKKGGADAAAESYAKSKDLLKVYLTAVEQ